VTETEYSRLMEFPFLKSEADLTAFTEWIRNTGNMNLINWLNNKLQPYIASGIFRFRSRMTDTAWATTNGTTNINESQHKWTNQHTGIKLPLAEAILKALEVDLDVLKEIKSSFESGVQKNPYNSSYNRLKHGL
ncbi:hypothetical protein BT96DRAFT_788089, partial [Gymnopus androsaceus JB14]